MSAVMLVSVTVPEMAKNETAMAEGNTDPPTFMENEPTITADSSLGGFITNAMKSEDIIEAGEQESDVQYSGDYGIEDVTFDTNTNTLSLFTWQIEDCTAVVGFYSDDGKRMYTSEKVKIPAENEVTTFDVDTTKLPESFLVEAYLINDQLMPLCNSYVYNKMTKEMQEILAKTVDDFDPELVVQIDETDDTNNFYVLSDNTILLDSNSETNTIVSADFETGTYVFGNIDDSMRNLAVGDIFSAATDLGVIAAEIQTITIDGDTATIVGTSDNEELFQFVKIDTSEMDPSLLDEYTVDMSAADEGVSLSDKSFDDTEIPADEDSLSGQETAEDHFASIGNLAPDTLAPKGEDQASVGLTAEPTFKIAEKKVGASGNGFSGKVNFVVSVPVEIKAEFYFSLGYSSFELKAGYAIKAKGSASISGELKIPLASIDFPIAGVFHLGLFPKFVVKGSVEVSVTYQKSFSAGFKWDTNTWELNKCDGLKLKVEDKLELNLEASFFIGLELDFKGYIISIKTCSISFPLDVGIKIKATLPIALLKVTDANGLESEGSFLHLVDVTTEEKPDTLYNCDAFVDISVDFHVKLSGELKIADYDWNPWKDKMSLKADIFEWTHNIGRFYLVVYPDSTGARKVEFGLWDSLKGKDFVLYKTTVKVYDKDKQPLSGAMISGNQATNNKGEVIYYCPPGTYDFTCSYNGEEKKKSVKVTNKKRTVNFIMGDPSSDPGGSDDPDDPYDPTDPNSPEAQESLKYLKWEENDEDGITITDCDQSAVKITIPREIDGKPVTSIGDSAFCNCRSLTFINIPGSVTSIGEGAFDGCESLTEITIPESVTSIGSTAFVKCINLITANIPDSVTIIECNAFGVCESITEITIPDGVTSIEDYAFGGCKSLTEITIPDSVTSIGDSAFSGCENLDSITILNPNCDIYYSSSTISGDYYGAIFNGTIYGYENSTAQEYAKKYGAKFVSLGAAPAASKTSQMPPMKTAPAEVEFTFTQEVPAADIYNFYVFADENAADLLSAENLLYIKQVQAAPDALSVEIPYILGGDYPDRVERLIRFESPDPGLVLDETSEDGTVSLIDYTGSAEELEIPAEMNGKPVTSIESGAFEGSSLVSVTVPESISSIGESAFAGCENLSTLTIQNPDCEIFDSAYTICNGFDEESGEPFFNGTIYGYEGSTAQAFAEKYGYSFEVLGETSDTDHKLGDLDGDGVIDSTDASSVLAEYAAIQTGAAPAVSTSVGDVNSDGFIDASDASDILQFYAYIQTGGTDSLSEFLRTR